MKSERLANAFRQLSAYERGQALWREDPRALAHVVELAARLERDLRAGTGRFARVARPLTTALHSVRP